MFCVVFCRSLCVPFDRCIIYPSLICPFWLPILVSSICIYFYIIWQYDLLQEHMFALIVYVDLKGVLFYLLFCPDSIKGITHSRNIESKWHVIQWWVNGDFWLEFVLYVIWGISLFNLYLFYFSIHQSTKYTWSKHIPYLQFIPFSNTIRYNTLIDGHMCRNPNILQRLSITCLKDIYMDTFNVFRHLLTTIIH